VDLGLNEFNEPEDFHVAANRFNFQINDARRTIALSLERIDYIETHGVSDAEDEVNELLHLIDASRRLMETLRPRAYIANTRANTIVSYDMHNDLAVMRQTTEEWDGFYYNDEWQTYNRPTGIFVGNDGRIYVCDSENNRIVVLNPDGQSANYIIYPPVSDILPSNFVFFPDKVVVDSVHNVYVVARNVTEGIMRFDDKGEFFTYMGTIPVNWDPLEWFWRLISTQRQLEGRARFIPTEFTNIDIDDRGFIYSVHADSAWGSQNNVHRLNPNGDNVLRRLHDQPLIGDRMTIRMGTGSSVANAGYTGLSRFVDVKAMKDGKYLVLDTQRSRVFAYDSEGNMLYVFGSPGTQIGTVFKPVAIDAYGESIFILDGTRGYLTEYRETEFGAAINSAISMRFNGNESDAAVQWRRVIDLCAGYQLAYDGIGKSYLADRNFSEAMRYFRLSANTRYYSIAFQQWRILFLQDYAPLFMSIIGAFIALIVLYRIKPINELVKYKILKRQRKVVEEKVFKH
jgi:DNA-binding beta-propeller fold protein YncE